MTQVTQMLRRRGVRALVLGLALMAVAVIVWVPPAPVGVPALVPAGFTARGAYHIHSDRSDGSGSSDDIAAAAARAGLDFIIVTDHGDGMRQPDVPQYRHGVLVIDAVELNTTNGHLVALGLPATPYPFAGTAADVLDDVGRLGGFAIAAHPDSPRPTLKWTAWDVPVDGLEWINADSEWRDESAAGLARALFGYPFRAPGAMASVFDRPNDLLKRWDEMGATRSVPALAAADAHARLGADDPDPSSFHVPLPGYETTFRAFSNHVVLDRALTGDGTVDALAVLTSIRQGRTFTVIDAIATPGGFDFRVENAVQAVGQMGSVVNLEEAVTVRARISAPPGTTLRILRNGAVVQETREAELSVRAESGVYRVEAYTAGAPGTPPVPWLLSNPIYVGLRHESPVTGEEALRSRIPARTQEAATEKGVNDSSELVDAQVADGRDRLLAGEPPLGWRFALAPGAPAGQFSAVQLPVTGGLAAFERVRFTVTSSGPMRAWLQLRAGEATERWGKTFYADAEPRVVELPLKAFLPIGVTSSAQPPLDRIASLLFVVDTLNSRPGASGALTISDVAFVR
jgi:hypothetical protein